MGERERERDSSGAFLLLSHVLCILSEWLKMMHGSLSHMLRHHAYGHLPDNLQPGDHVWEDNDKFEIC